MAATVQKKIQILTEFLTKGLRKFQKQTETIGKMSKKAETLTLASEKLKVSTARLQQGLSTQGLAVNKAGRVFDKLTGRIRGTEKAMESAKKMTHRFQMEMLSILFFGMFLQRVFLGIMRSAVTSFTKIMESNNILGTAVQRLGVHFEFLKFTIGSAINTALEPFLPLIINIIKGITEWVQKHPKLTTAIITFGLALGGAMMIFAIFKLGFDGILALFTGTKISKAISSLKNLNTAMRNIGGILAITLGTSLFFSGLNEEDAEIALGKLIGAGIAAGIAILIFGGGPVAAIAIGALVATVGLEIKFKFLSKAFEKLKESRFMKAIAGTEAERREFGFFKQERPLDVIYDLNLGIANTREAFEKLNSTGKKTQEELREQIGKTGFMIGSRVRGSFPLVYSLNQASLSWTSMADVAVEDIRRILSELDRIPREIVTVHRIVTVHEGSSNDNLLNEIKRFR